MISALVIGAGRFGAVLVQQMAQFDYEIMVVDQNEDRVNAIMPFVTDAQIGDSTNPAFIRTLGVDNYDLCFVTTSDNFQTSLETTSLLKELGAKRVIARAKNEVQEKFLLRNGADEVVYPEKQASLRLATKYASETILDFLQFEGGYSIYELAVPDFWYGMTLPQLDVRKKFDINIISLRRNGQVTIPRPDDAFREGDVIYAVGEMKNIQKCFRI